MRRVRAGPERDAAIQRLRDDMAADEAALRQPPFTVAGLAPPIPGPACLGGLEKVNGQITRVELRYGARDPSAGPRVAVSSAPVRGNAESLPVADLLRDLLRRDQADHDAEPAAHGAAEVREVLVDGIPRVTHTLGSGRAWAAIAQVTLGDVALLVTVAARDWPMSELALASVDDLEPFLTGRRERVEAALARFGTRPGPEDWELPPARGLEGHRALAEAMIARSAGGLRRGADLGSDHARRWEVATRAQIALAGQQREQAEDAVTSMANQLCQLAESANWFGNPALADRAIAETLDYVAFSRDVPSAAAQRAWSAYWSLHGQEPPAFTALASAKDAWLTAWQRWAERS